MEEGFDLLGELPCEVREMVVAYLTPLGITLAYGRSVCKYWRGFIPRPVRPQTWSCTHFMRLLYFESDDVCRVAVHLMREFIWDGADDGIWRNFDEALEAVARADKPVLFSYFLRFPRENRRDPYRRNGRAKQPNGITLDIQSVQELLLRCGSARILASVIPALWTLSWKERVDLFWSNAKHYTSATLGILLAHSVVDLRQRSWNGLIEDADPDALICGDSLSFPEHDTRFLLVLRTIASTLSPEGIQQFFGTWIYHLVKTADNLVCLDSMWTAVQIVLFSGFHLVDLCEVLDKSDRLAMHPMIFHICHCDARLMQQESSRKRAKVPDNGHE